MKKYILLIGAIALLSNCSNQSSENNAKEQTSAQPTSILTLTDAQLKNIEMDTISFQNISLPTIVRLNAKTEVTPQHTVSITNAFGGYVKAITLIPGNTVTKGQVLVVLEDPQYIQMQEDYLTTKALLEQANADFIRQRDLNSEQAASDKVLQQAKANRQTLMVKKRALEEKLKLMNIHPNAVSINTIKRTINVYAPISGIVNSVSTNTGQYVSPADAMVEIINPNSALLNIKVFEKDLYEVNIGQELKAYTNSNPNQKLTAKITSISKEIKDDGTVDVYAQITNPNGIKITANMYLNVELTVHRMATNVLPEEAVVHFEGKDYAFEVLKNNQFKLIPVEIGQTHQNQVEIKSPINQGKVYVSKGAYQLLTAMKNSGDNE
ncbi:efflux RND transporter periplasmic adaptor subunit [Faecalibacter sp. LW9]|uniref:efflux RND transporter periplasmic adaptor subunit n=1 Tax=Faecalibacter sp. LW9 TaxID=3103144 RepID=UPI002AFDEF6D|nr:efflux RND transporter periplasmic adaptor subunit [Faecalibacter sp. LW9]